MVNATGDLGRAGFEILGPTGVPEPIVGHVPHASVAIPDGVRAGILLDDAALDLERLRLTDWRTDRLYAWIRDLGGSLFVNRVSRLVVDPERFADDASEPMARVGQGAVYTRTADGSPLRLPDPVERARLLDRWYVPYHAALGTLVGEALDAFDRCLVIDGHSFASLPLPSEPDHDPDRPDVCVGTDPFHTPPALADGLREALLAEGFRVSVDRPFTGALVPLRWYRRDARVAAVMLEVRRGTYCDEATGEPLPGFEDIVARLRRAVARVLADHGWTAPARVTRPGPRGAYSREMSKSTNGAPRLSVIVPAWNAEATIATAVGSVLDQRDVDLECVVVDDGSTDGTMGVLEGLANADDRLVLERMPANGGVSAARNRALELARGDWLTFLDADDRLLPGGLGAMVRAGDATNALVVVGQRISTDGERTWFPKSYDVPDIREPGRKSLATHPDLLYYVGPVGKLFDRSVSADLRFEGRVLGDQPWVVSVLVRAGDRIEVVGDLVYEWRRPPPGSAVTTITSARERSAAMGAEAVRMAGVAFDVASGAFGEAYDPATRERMEAQYLRRLVRADLAAQLHRAIERHDPDLPLILGALAELLAHVPSAVVIGTEDAVRTEVIDHVLRRILYLSPPARHAALDLLVEAARIDPGLLRGVRSRSVRWSLRLAVTLPVAGKPLAELMLKRRVAVSGRRRP